MRHRRKTVKLGRRSDHKHALLANLAMLNGLLGTVTGLIKSFGAVAGQSVDPSQKATILQDRRR